MMQNQQFDGLEKFKKTWSDSNKIIAGGGSAGGALALTGTVSMFDENEDKEISSKPIQWSCLTR